MRRRASFSNASPEEADNPMFSGKKTLPCQKPRLTLQVGVTGHRPDGLTGVDLPKLRHLLIERIAERSEGMTKLLAALAEELRQGPPPSAGQLVEQVWEVIDVMSQELCLAIEILGIYQLQPSG